MKISTLKPLQLTALQLLAMGTPPTQVAERLEVSYMTIYRWQRLPEFESKLRTITNSGLEEIARKLNATTITAIETLQEILCDFREPSSVRMKAAISVMSIMPSINVALEKSLKHRVADFDLKDRWGEPGCTYDSSCNPCQRPVVSVSSMSSGEVVV